MSSPVNIDLDALPEIKSYAATTSTAGSVNLTDSGSSYEKLPVGVSTISVSSKQSKLYVYLTTDMGAAYRYVTKEPEAGETVVISNVAVPKGEKRYLQIRCDNPCDVGVTIITYPLA
ncbi:MULTISPECIES: hypothetical protein [Corynebacterium]|uniref:Uncharacterized protein n=1 Tax=Corynebacterium ihumii TaxID=1232427 RepID=A0ABY7UAF5_9CORY|nr:MULTISPECIES: hypothetical protein [Corynebacterium]WCZ33667.1 hypothetical protein CIHUM_01100 [Corynebacterium ihumii]